MLRQTIQAALHLRWLTTEKIQNYETVHGGCIPSKNKFFLYPYKNYNTCYIYVLLYFLITLQQYNTTGTRPQGAKDNDYPVAVNIKTCKKTISKLRLDTNT